MVISIERAGRPMGTSINLGVAASLVGITPVPSRVSMTWDGSTSWAHVVASNGLLYSAEGPSPGQAARALQDHLEDVEPALAAALASDLPPV